MQKREGLKTDREERERRQRKRLGVVSESLRGAEAYAVEPEGGDSGGGNALSGVILGVGIITLVSAAAITAQKKASLRRKRTRRGSQRYRR